MLLKVRRMDFTSIKRLRGQSNRAGPQGSSPAARSAVAPTFERHLREIANSGGAAIPAGSAPQPAQSAQFLKRLSKRPLHPGDSEPILGLEAALIKGNAAEGTAKNEVSTLLRFGHWLFENKKAPIMNRLDEQSLTNDVHEFIGPGKPAGGLARVSNAIGHLCTSQSTEDVVPMAVHAELKHCPKDAVLVEEYKTEAATETGRRNATALRSFSGYLRQNNKMGIADRLSGKALDGDIKRYKQDAGGDRTIGSALARL
ncbi:hypothetical protein EH240_14315 [Mesorhizobium tamadayense]|uniref:Uncharacterized protein n=1 Tax=Mesorhizobium tamadayense TaxID=425306 RepID=A0A3P3FS91_9HYPH|nr:hypothetical protein [Mesorhizobium tamadayense]RRI01485.1 hypothetical protein EH240_14315 [Mesorhizobium tamadayense]